MKKSIKAIIQARMSSTRLPGKVLMEINNRPLLSYMIERLSRSKLLDEIIIATTKSDNDEPIVRWCKDNSFCFYRGDEEDVLGRYYGAAKKYKASVIVRITSDCPLIDPELVDKVIQCYLDKGEVDFVSDTVPLPCLYPDGMDVEVFNMNVLTKAHKEAKLPSEREHVTFYMWKTGKFKVYRVDPAEDISKYRFCIDYPQDFAVMKEILGGLYLRKPDFSMYDLINFMEKNPHLLQIQTGIQRNAGWQRAFERDCLVLESQNKDGAKR